jgi:hypothetical protein
LGSKTLHGIDIGLGMQEAGLDVSLLFEIDGLGLALAPRPWVLTAATQRGVEPDDLTAVPNLLLIRSRLWRGRRK